MRTKIGKLLVFYMFPFTLRSQEDSTGKVNTLLDFSLEELMKVEVVPASVSGQKLGNAPSTILIITAQQIKERGYEELSDALRDVPVIDFIHLNGYVPTLIYFRGMYGAENLRALLMIDGIPENNIAGTNDMAGPAYSLHNVERIEIIWGPASAIYGANAFGGFINIITKKAETMNGLIVQQGQGNLNTSFEKVAFGMKKGAVDISFAGSLFRTDGPLLEERSRNYTNSYVYNAYSFSSSIGYTSSKCKAMIGYRAFDTPMGWGTLLNIPTKFLGLLPQGNGNVGTVGIFPENFRGEKPGRYEPYARTAFIQNSYAPIAKWSVFTMAEFRETGISEKSYVYITVDAKKLYRLPTTQYSNCWGGKISSTYAINERHKISLGAEFYQDNLEQGARKVNLDTNHYTVNGQFLVTGLYSNFDKRRFVIWNNFGSFLQYELHTKWLRETHFTIGTRYDINSIYGNPVSPRIAIVNQPTDKLTFKLLYGEQTAKRFSENDTTFAIPNIAAMKGNIGLRFQVADLFNLSLIGNWVGERNVPGSTPHGPVDGYFITNASITTHRFFKDHVYLSLAIKNLFDVKYLDPGIRAADGLLYSTVLEQPGITGIFKVTVNS